MNLPTPVPVTIENTWCHPECPYAGQMTGILLYCRLLKRMVDYYDGPLAECQVNCGSVGADKQFTKNTL